MKTVKYGKNNDAQADVPETWAEGQEMIEQAMNAFHDRRGGNMERISVAARVALGMFGEQFVAPDPTTALLNLMHRICELEGAGLDRERA
jgi:hypothetical protein